MELVFRLTLGQQEHLQVVEAVVAAGAVLGRAEMEAQVVMVEPALQRQHPGLLRQQIRAPGAAVAVAVLETQMLAVQAVLAAQAISKLNTQYNLIRTKP